MSGPIKPQFTPAAPRGSLVMESLPGQKLTPIRGFEGRVFNPTSSRRSRVSSRYGDGLAVGRGAAGSSVWTMTGVLGILPVRGHSPVPPPPHLPPLSQRRTTGCRLARPRLVASPLWGALCQRGPGAHTMQLVCIQPTCLCKGMTSPPCQIGPSVQIVVFPNWQTPHKPCLLTHPSAQPLFLTPSVPLLLVVYRRTPLSRPLCVRPPR